MNARENSRDFDWLSDPKNWLHWPICPVKRFTNPKDMPECGLVWAGELTHVYIQNLCLMVSGAVEPQFKDCKKYEYESLQEMLADGWMVD